RAAPARGRAKPPRRAVPATPRPGRCGLPRTPYPGPRPPNGEHQAPPQTPRAARTQYRARASTRPERADQPWGGIVTTTPDTTLTSGDRRTTRAGPGSLGRLAGVAYRRRGRVILGCLPAFARVTGPAAAFAGDFAADYSVPGSDSKQAQDLLAQRFPVQAGDTVDVVVRSDAGVTGSAARSDVTALLRKLGGMPHVAAVENP